MKKNQPKKNLTAHHYLFKGEPGVYGKNNKQAKAEDFVELKPNVNIPEIPVSTPISIYHKKKEELLNQNQILNLLFIILLVILLLLNFVFYHKFTSELGKNFQLLISNLCFAYIASYIFYRIVIKRTDKLKKRETYAIVCGLTETLLIHGKSVEKWVIKGTEKEKEIEKLQSIDRATFSRICSQVDITKKSEGNQMPIGNLIIIDGVKKVNFYIEQIFNYMPFLDGEFLNYLNKIQNSRFTRMIPILPFKQNKDLKEFSNEIYDYLQLLKKLEEYNESLKKLYLKNYEMKY